MKNYTNILRAKPALLEKVLRIFYAVCLVYLMHTSIVNDLIITSVETDQKPKQTINVKEVNIKTTKKQSITAINQIVEKVQTLLNSTEFQEESKAVVRFLAILRVLYRTNPESFAHATESLQDVHGSILLVMKRHY